MKGTKGFTIGELAIIVLIVGLLLGAVLRGSDMVQQAKKEKQVQDFRELVSKVRAYHRNFGRWPGDYDGDGAFDSSRGVWNDLLEENLISRVKHSPYGCDYKFKYTYVRGRVGNCVSCLLPPEVARYVDKHTDDGLYFSGSVRASGSYSTSTGRVTLYFFVD